MDTNAAQFARMGFPWSDAAPEAALPTRASRKIRKAAPNMAKAKPEFREEGYVRRALTAEEERRAKHRAGLSQIRGLLAAQSIRPMHHGSDRPLVEPKRCPKHAAEQAERLAKREREGWDRRSDAEIREAEVRAARTAKRNAAFRAQAEAFAARMAEALGD